MIPIQPTFYSVSLITEEIKQALEEGFSDVGIEGEVSNFRGSSAGHWYFTLKDDYASISGVMFRSRTYRAGFMPKDGMKVRVIGTVSVYKPRGTYQIICEAIEQAGMGEILLRLEELKNRLQREGLFNPEKKRPLPVCPTTIGVITSPSGAALRDILNVLKRRHSGIHVIVYPSAVQGSDAPGELKRQLEKANSHGKADVLILTRGGGSLEDLLPFSDEALVRTAASSKIPLISAVGHEVDWALCDFAADLRAPTPSAAAELVSSTSEELLGTASRLVSSMADSVQRRLERSRLLLDRFSPRYLGETFAALIMPHRLKTDDLLHQAELGIQGRLKQTSHALSLLEREITAGSPLAVMERGFSVVVRTKDGKVINDASLLSCPEPVHIRFFRGEADAVIQEKRP